MNDHPRNGVALGVGSRFTPANKALQIQVLSDSTKGSEQAEVNFADAFLGWFVVAPPLTQATDASGNISAATEFLTAEVGDQLVMHGSRDVRVSKYGQDVLPGEFALINELGYRLFVGKKAVSLTAAGGFLNFDVENKKVGIAGIPAAAGSPVPYISITTDTIGLVSASGAASLALSDSGVSISGATLALDMGRVNIGKGATDPVVTYSQMMSVIGQLLITFNTHVHSAAGAGPPVTPMVLVLIPNSRVFAPPV